MSMDPLAQNMEKILESLGIPKRIFVGVDQASGASYSAIAIKWQEEKFKKWQKELQERVKKEYIVPLIAEMLNPLEFAYLLPLGKKAYCRWYPEGWKKSRIEWPAIPNSPVD
jgi:hypothetical protein